MKKEQGTPFMISPFSSPSPGLVSLVGAGPGDPELLTLRALRRLQEADLVLHDALVREELLMLAPRARYVFVGKRAGRPSVTQETIHRLMIRAARRGRRVVRLKCGDPFVLGRGGEEALALTEAGIPFEVIPGVSSALSAPALLGIPVTHRGVASGFCVLSGHAPSVYEPILDTLAPRALTLVVLMGLAHREGIARKLRERGWSDETPAAIVQGASHPGEALWTGRLSELGGAPLPGDPSLPGILVIGEVVSLAREIGQSLHITQQPPLWAREAG